jgi:hypothetical protein
MFRKLTFLVPLLVAALASSSAFCGAPGETATMNQIKALLMECRHDDALALLDEAEENGAMGMDLGELERVIILYDAGRVDDAEAAFENWQEVTGADGRKVQRERQAWELSLQQMQQERRIRTGSPVCE